ncbi:MAG: ABC transporter substrate-binding protein [Candidatus Nitrosotenuis sp.]|nr:MAG: ABC transporter substrate-binding protein [Candidatus Nitrosotenuis sp.]
MFVKKSVGIVGAGITAAVIIGAIMVFAMNQNATQTSPDNKLESPKEKTETAKLNVVASFYPLYQFSKGVGGDKVDVSTLIPSGIEPHEWEPSPGDLVSLKHANVFVYNGVGMEPFIDRLIASEEYKNTVFVESTKKIELIKITDENEARFMNNPHVWLDPILAKQQVAEIKDAFSKADPSNADYYAQNADDYNAKLDALDAKIRSGLSDCKKDTFMPFHDAYPYFAKRYGLKSLPLSGISPDSEITSSELKKFVDYVKANHVQVIFDEELVDPRLAQVLADEAGAKVMVFSPLEGLTDDEIKAGMTYFDKMDENLQNIKVALECS